MSEAERYPPVSAISTGLRGRCPRCGQGPLFDGFIKLHERCRVCGLDFGSFDPGDGPAVFVILIAGFLIVAGVLVVEVAYQPPYWVHAVLWLPLSVGLPALLLRRLKGVLIALEYQNKAAEGRLAGRDC
jgi:uncharacterized protein (DUF983 family)